MKNEEYLFLLKKSVFKLVSPFITKGGSVVRLLWDKSSTWTRFKLSNAPLVMISIELWDKSKCCNELKSVNISWKISVSLFICNFRFWRDVKPSKVVLCMDEMMFPSRSNDSSKFCFVKIDEPVKKWIFNGSISLPSFIPNPIIQIEILWFGFLFIRH